VCEREREDFHVSFNLPFFISLKNNVEMANATEKGSLKKRKGNLRPFMQLNSYLKKHILKVKKL